MSEWQKEILKLANDFCLNMAEAKAMVRSVDTISVPQGKSESEYKYNCAHRKLKDMIKEALWA